MSFKNNHEIQEAAHSGSLGGDGPGFEPQLSKLEKQSSSIFVILLEYGNSTKLGSKAAASGAPVLVVRVK